MLLPRVLACTMSSVSIACRLLNSFSRSAAKACVWDGRRHHFSQQATAVHAIVGCRTASPGRGKGLWGRNCKERQHLVSRRPELSPMPCDRQATWQ